MRKYELTINGKDYRVQVLNFSTEEATLRIKGKTYTVNVKDIVETKSSVANKLKSSTSNLIGMLTPSKSSASTPAPAASAEGVAVVAPLPGEISEIFVKEGDKVDTDKVVLKMEAMKMENSIKSTAVGTVKTILVKPGDAVSEGQDLMVIE